MENKNVQTPEAERVVEAKPKKKAGFRSFLKAHRHGIIGGLIGVAIGTAIGVAGHKVYVKKTDVKAVTELPAIPEAASDTSTDNVTL
jgi:hypothetical protein